MRTTQPAGSPGYTFPLMLIIVAAMAFGAARLDLAQSYRSKRDKEAELLFRGLAYRLAIKEFYSKNNRYPRQLKELANDKDSSKRRFIRQLYKDPMTGGDFKFILGSEGAIMGVASSSKDVPFKKVDFEKELENFEKAKTYADWKFEAKPGSGAHQGNTPASSPPQRSGGPL